MTSIAVVGAGLSGLRCASLLSESGHEVDVYEASDGVGGRARTDEVEGFRLDRGFQVLLTAYPEARRTFDYGSLSLGDFEPGAAVRVNGKFSSLLDPLRRPAAGFAALGSPVMGIADKLRVARMWLDLTSTGPEEILARPDMTALESLKRRGFSDHAIDRFFLPFFGGVFIDPELQSSSRLLEIFFRCFASAPAALPAGGMGRLSESIAEKLPAGSIHLGSPVREVSSEGFRRDDGEWIEAAAVVVATDERAAADLAGVPEPGPSRVTTTVYYDAPAGDVGGAILRLSPAGRGPINELSVPSEVAEGYAPHGRSLIAATSIGEVALGEGLEDGVETQLSEWFGPATVSTWNHLATRTIRDALPAFVPGRFEPGGLPPRLESGVFVCGDHRESPSIQGALVSGRKAAEAVLGHLGSA